jgi:hypothetical protein
MLPRRSRFVWLPALALATGLAAFSLAAACEWRSPETRRADLFAALATLWSGRPDERRETAEDAQGWSVALQTSDLSDEEIRRAVDSLRSSLHTERDDWIQARVLQNLLDRSVATLTPLYLEALDDPSPNVRWRGIAWFRERADPQARPLLERLWRFEDRPWVLVDLIEALARNGSDRFLDDFVGLARGGDPALAVAAIGALGSRMDERLVPVLAALARAQNPHVAAAAIEALAAWHESPAAREGVRRALQRAGSDALILALPKIQESVDENAARQLLVMASEEADPAVRCRALTALAQAQPDGLEDLLVQTLLDASPEDASREEADPIQRAALYLLNQLDDASVVARLGHLDARLGGEYLNLGSLLEDLSRDRDLAKDSWSEPTCSEIASPLESPKALISPPEGLHSLRCWEYPGVSGAPEIFRRVPVGTEAEITDHFEQGDESWVLVYTTFDWPSCWIAAHHLRPLASEDEPQEEGDPFSLEIDLPLEEAGSRAARSLSAAGVMEGIDPGSAVMGFALRVDPEDSTVVPRLISAYQDDGSLLDEALAVLLSALRAAHPKRPELQEFFGRHPSLRKDEDP